MGLFAAILWVVFVVFGWAAVGLPALDVWPAVLIGALGVFFIAAVSRN